MFTFAEKYDFMKLLDEKENIYFEPLNNLWNYENILMNLIFSYLNLSGEFFLTFFRIFLLYWLNEWTCCLNSIDWTCEKWNQLDFYGGLRKIAKRFFSWKLFDLIYFRLRVVKRSKFMWIFQTVNDDDFCSQCSIDTCENFCYFFLFNLFSFIPFRQVCVFYISLSFYVHCDSMQLKTT